MLRASLDRTKGDPDWDLRKTEPYCGYEGYQFDVPIPPYTVLPTAVGADDGGPGSGRTASVTPVLASTTVNEKSNVDGTRTTPFTYVGGP